MRAKDEMVPVTITIGQDLLAELDERLRELDLNRSQYVRRLVRRDIADRAKEHEGKEAA